MSTFQAISLKMRPLRHLLVVLCCFTFGAAAQLQANPERQSEHAVLYLATQYEKEGYDFRSDIWQRELKPEIGKAVRIQLFKGNEYRICLSVPPQSGVQIEAHLLDGNGKKIEKMIQTTEGSWGAVLHVTPPGTGIYMLTVRRSGGTETATICSMISGYK